tara:strand:+ start:165 stop:848 length:684 start_codon:yes stop_codon:yes gene_type:complete
MKKLRISIIALVATFAMISSSFAFEGLSFGGIYNDATFDTSGREMKGQKNSANEASARTSISKSQAYGSYFVEYTLPQGSTFGIELIPGDASLGAKTRVHTLNGTGQNVAGTITAKAEVSDHTLIYAEPTKMFNDTFGVYLKGGISKVTVNTLDSQTATTIAGKYGSEDVFGSAYGIGAKAYRGNMFIKLEHLTTDYGNMTFVSTTNKTIEADIDQKATRIALGYNF